MPESVVEEQRPEPKKSLCFGCCCCFPKGETIEEKAERLASKNKMAHTSTLPKDFSEGSYITVTAVVQPNCSRFAVNLTCGGKGGAASPDIAFHFNPRLAQRYIVRNSRLNGQWGDEDTAMAAKFSFVRGKKFNLGILACRDEFLVALDGVHLFPFRFRVPLTKLAAVQVEGCVDDCRVEYKKLEKYPEPIPDQNKALTVARGLRMPPTQGDDDVKETAMDTPVTFLLPKSFQRDWQLEIYGRIKILPHSFYVNLQQGSHIWPHPIIPLHLNPRFVCAGTTGPLFVRNAWIEGGWGQEERTPGFQFSPGSPFTMAIRRGNDHFSVWIDGKLAGEFKFRGNEGPSSWCDKIDTVLIQGDVVIYRVGLDESAASK